MMPVHHIEGTTTYNQQSNQKVNMFAKPNEIINKHKWEPVSFKHWILELNLPHLYESSIYVIGVFVLVWISIVVDVKFLSS